MGPMTIIILIAVIAFSLAGLAMILRSIHRRSQTGRTVVCQRCRTVNAGHANFCSQCGASLQ